MQGFLNLSLVLATDVQTLQGALTALLLDLRALNMAGMKDLITPFLKVV